MALRTPLAALSIMLASACVEPPSVFCDDTRVAWGFDDHDITAADDVSDEPGIQINVLLLTALPAGKPASLTVTGPDEVEVAHPVGSRVDTDGRILFEAVSVPAGSIIFTVRTANDCAEVESRRRRFVLEVGGPAVCELNFVPRTRPVVGSSTLRAYTADDDQDADTDGMQVSVRARTGRSEMGVRLLILNRETESSETLDQTTESDGETTFSITLDEGENAIRGLCTDGPNATPQTSATFEVLVDSLPPDCALIEPSARVVAADDLDGDLGNGIQFLAVAQTNDESNFGLEAHFSVNGGEAVAAAIGAAGQAATTMTVANVGGAQVFEVTVPDLAGNQCTASAMF